LFDDQLASVPMSVRAIGSYLDEAHGYASNAVAKPGSLHLSDDPLELLMKTMNPPSDAVMNEYWRHDAMRSTIEALEPCKQLQAVPQRAGRGEDFAISEHVRLSEMATRIRGAALGHRSLPELNEVLDLVDHLEELRHPARAQRSVSRVDADAVGAQHADVDGEALRALGAGRPAESHREHGLPACTATPGACWRPRSRGHCLNPTRN
jgi:hypothetical protein